jgi:hypothetical protein
LYSPTFWKCFQWMRENATELISAVLPGAGQLGHQRQDVPRRRVARRHVRHVDQAVAHRVEGSGRRRGRLRQRR